MLADGRYRPGIYAHTRTPATIYDDVSEVYDTAGVDGDPPFWIAGTGSFSPESSPTDVGHAFATAWQGSARRRSHAQRREAAGRHQRRVGRVAERGAVIPSS